MRGLDPKMAALRFLVWLLLARCSHNHIDKLHQRAFAPLRSNCISEFIYHCSSITAQLVHNDGHCAWILCLRQQPRLR